MSLNYSVVVIACLAVAYAGRPEPLEQNTGCLELRDFRLPVGFCASIVIDSLEGNARHIAVSPDGNVYVVLWAYQSSAPAGSIVAIRTSSTKQLREPVARFGTRGGDYIQWNDGFLYVSTANSIERYRISPGEVIPSAPAEVVVRDLPQFADPEHGSKTFAINGDRLLIHIGAPSNACQEINREVGSKGIQPCPFLEQSAGVWSFPVGKLNMSFAEGVRTVSGVRHTRGMQVAPWGGVYAVIHGRDLLFQNWPGVFNERRAADAVADELALFDDGRNFGWPYCYFDSFQNRRVLAPEYGGDGIREGECGDAAAPVSPLPAHSAPNDLLFYIGNRFPRKYQQGVFLAFHGGWGRSPLPQNGYAVGFLPLKDGRVAGALETFAAGFAGVPVVSRPAQAVYRPIGLAQSRDGALYILDSRRGRIWRVDYTGGAIGV